MSGIPSEVLREILLLLPAESLLRFRAVCKEWRRLIDDPSFIKTHANNRLSSNTLLMRHDYGGALYSLNLDALNFSDDHQTIPVKKLARPDMSQFPPFPLSSCNSLILIAGERYSYDSKWVIWNPSTRECLKLPQCEARYSMMARGLGYDYATDDYKVVRVHEVHVHHKSRDFSDGEGSDRVDPYVYKTHVYSLKLGYWRIIENFPHACERDGEGVFLNGALHWLSRACDTIIVLDLATEDYRQLSVPPIPSSNSVSDPKLDALGGCLVLSYYHPTMKCFDGWVMNDYGVEESWIKLFSLEKRVIIKDPKDRKRLRQDRKTLRPVAYLKSKERVLLQCERGLLWVDVGNDSVKKFTISGSTFAPISSSQICPDSLFRLGDSGSVAANKSAGL